MEQVSFLGSLDKKDLILTIANVFTSLDYKVLLVDATLMQRLKYIVPYVGEKKTITYVAEYQGIDVALGFMRLEDIARYLGKEKLDYDFVLIDSDNVQTMNSFDITKSEKIYFVTSYDQYEVARMVETFQYYNKPMEVTKAIVSADLSDKQAQYLNYLMNQTLVKLKDVGIQFIDTIEDRKAALENQLTKEIRLKHYTTTYKDSLTYITSLIGEKTINPNDIKKVIKKL